MKGILGGHPGESGVFRTDHDGGRSGAAGRSDTPVARPSAAATDSPEQAAVIHAPTDADMLVVAGAGSGKTSVSYSHFRAHETGLDPVCRLLLGKKQ